MNIRIAHISSDNEVIIGNFSGIEEIKEGFHAVKITDDQGETFICMGIVVPYTTEVEQLLKTIDNPWSFFKGMKLFFQTIDLIRNLGLTEILNTNLNYVVRNIHFV